MLNLDGSRTEPGGGGTWRGLIGNWTNFESGPEGLQVFAQGPYLGYRLRAFNLKWLA